jgi:hypothetical protein
MVYSGDLKSPVERHAGSSPATRTKLFLKYFKNVLTESRIDYIMYIVN